MFSGKGKMVNKNVTTITILYVVFQQPLVHLVRSGDFHLFFLHSFCVDSVIFRSYHCKNSDNAKTAKGKTRLAKLCFCCLVMLKPMCSIPSLLRLSLYNAYLDSQ